MSKVMLIAAVAHAANKEYCEQNGDRSQPTWEFAPRWQRESAIAGVEAVMENPDQTPEQSHESWLAHKEEDGWTYGEVKDPLGKTHPCMVPYDELPEEQRAKDAIFTAVVKALI